MGNKIKPGKPWPLGSTITSEGVNFSVAAPNAAGIDLLIFEKAEDKKPNQIFKLNNFNRSGDYWHIEIKGEAEGCLYAYRVYEQEDNKERRHHR